MRGRKNKSSGNGTCLYRALFDLYRDKVDVSALSFDATYFMERVQARSGKVLYYQVITPIAADHHSSRFDFDERGLSLAVILHAEMSKRLLKRAHVRS